MKKVWPVESRKTIKSSSGNMYVPKQKLLPRLIVNTLKVQDGSLTTNDSERANILNEFFASVFEVEGIVCPQMWFRNSP